MSSIETTYPPTNSPHNSANGEQHLEQVPEQAQHQRRVHKEKLRDYVSRLDSTAHYWSMDYETYVQWKQAIELAIYPLMKGLE